jgi:hypothetical protein
VAKKFIEQDICDRCGNVIEEVESDGPAPGSSDQEPYFVAEIEGTEVVSFIDICEKCRARVGVLIGQIKLEKPPAKEAKPNGAETEPPVIPPDDQNEGEAANATA